MTKKKIQVFLSAVILLVFIGGSSSALAQERKTSRVERRADRNFIRQKFDKAMTQYETAINNEEDDASKASVHLKTARLYFMLRDYALSCLHYEKALEMNEEMLNVDDVCNYVDALRFQGLNKEAEAICLNNTFKYMYSRSQRYQNTLEALAMRHAMLEEPGFSVNKLLLNTPSAEYWVGSLGDKPFYAMSPSKFNDPGKLFFHRTHYYMLNEEHEPGSKPQEAPRYYDFFRHIPVDMQNGPLTYSPEKQTIVTTVITYHKAKTTVDMVDKSARPFFTQLFYSTLQYNQKRFKKYTLLFPQEPNCSYAHPYLFNEGKSLLFTSDMPGGYGGFDLYVSHFDEYTGEWGTPINLGPELNTEGDEIFPVIFEDRLIFSSNGLPGFGGYDLFSVLFENGEIAPGSVYHFPYPVNSVFNDYYMYPLDLHTAYFASDRDLESQDDLYFLRTDNEIGSGQAKPFYGMTEEAAVMGGQLLLGSMIETAAAETITLKQYAPKGLLLTLYFDFDSSELTPESVNRLQTFISEMGAYQFNELAIDGYTDEIGSDYYNQVLSERRASKVAEYLQWNGVQTMFNVKGYGRLKLSPQEVEEEVSHFPWAEDGIDWVRVNRRARRVEIYNK